MDPNLGLRGRLVSVFVPIAVDQRYEYRYRAIGYPHGLPRYPTKYHACGLEEYLAIREC